MSLKSRDENLSVAQKLGLCALLQNYSASPLHLTQLYQVLKLLNSRGPGRNAAIFLPMLVLES